MNQLALYPNSEGNDLQINFLFVSTIDNYAQRYGVDLSLARVHSNVHQLLELTGVIDEIGDGRIYETVRHAVDASTALASGKQGSKGGSA